VATTKVEKRMGYGSHKEEGSPARLTAPSCIDEGHSKREEDPQGMDPPQSTMATLIRTEHIGLRAYLTLKSRNWRIIRKPAHFGKI
jgi:hypothetical protein